MDRQELGILLVEDNASDIELTLHALRHNHVVNRIHVARDGAEALEFIFNPDVSSDRLRAPLLILLDLKLPKVDGLEVLRIIKSDPQTRVIPVIVMISCREDQDLVRSYPLGVNSYIQKPVDFDDFCKVVQHLGYDWLLINEPAPREALSHTEG